MFNALAVSACVPNLYILFSISSSDFSFFWISLHISSKNDPMHNPPTIFVLLVWKSTIFHSLGTITWKIRIETQKQN